MSPEGHGLVAGGVAWDLAVAPPGCGPYRSYGGIRGDHGERPLVRMHGTLARSGNLSYVGWPVAAALDGPPEHPVGGA